MKIYVFITFLAISLAVTGYTNGRPLANKITGFSVQMASGDAYVLPSNISNTVKRITNKRVR